MMRDDELVAAILARPDLCARVVAAHKPKKAKPPALGASPKQKAAFLRLSSARQEYIAAWENWRRGWKQWRYFGAAYPGPEPIDTESPEALAQAARMAGLNRVSEEAAARLIARWGGDLNYAVKRRDSANLAAPRRASFSGTDAEHAVAVQKFLDSASAASRAEWAATQREKEPAQ
ncbi:MAG: hypothetical protein INH13_25780 [Cupriavidus sp.]|nr:hypothetical protein [Cupriavidus sp.]